MAAEDCGAVHFVLPFMLSFGIGMYAGVVLSGRLWCDYGREESLKRYEKGIALEMELAKKQEEARKLKENLPESSLLFKHEKGPDAEKTHFEVTHRGSTMRRDSSDDEAPEVESRTEE
jgi:hypothetical protein